LLVIGIALVGVTLPHVGFMWRRETVDEFFVLSLTDERCAAAGPFGSPDHYACLHERMWLQTSIINDASQVSGRQGGR
jgi:hypothetical protein